MHLQWIVFVSLSVLMLVEETISSLNEITMYRNESGTPLALIKRHDSTTPQLAKPQKNIHPYDYVSYYYDRSKEEFLIACPEFYDGKEPATKEYWRETGTPAKDSQLLFQTQLMTDHWQCFWELVPSIKKIDKENTGGDGVTYCSQSQAEIYGVGYEDIQYAFVYKICYSKAEGKTLYSIHRIETPDLLFLDYTAEFPNLEPLIGQYESFLDPSLSTKTHFESEKYYAYQNVGTGDMLIGPWKLTTYFLFNYTPITRNGDLFKGMIRADVYIRLYSKKNNKPLTVYSGTHQTWISRKIFCSSWFCKPKSTPIDSFWRLIMDDEGHAIILVAQHTLKKCGNAYLCEKNRRVKTYKRGGCIYTCSLNANDPILRMLDLPDLEINGDLDFTIHTEKTEITSSQKQNSSTKNSVDIFHFLENNSFLYAIEQIDPVIAKRIIYQ